MKGTALALCAAISIGDNESAPEWLHLLPAREARTFDGRGPYRITDATALMAASMAGGKLILDENHSTDLAAPRGLSAPACGYITELQERADGIWGRVSWTPAALNAQIWRGYRGVSPALRHKPDFTATAIARASLTNLPNIDGLTSLHMEGNGMDFRVQLLEALGLGSDADDAAIIAAIAAMKKAGDPAVALNAALKPIAQVVGVADDADAATVLAGVQQLKSGGDSSIVALQSEVTTLTTSLNSVREEQRRDKAIAFVDAAIGAGRVGVKPQRDEYIALHMSDSVRAEKLIGAMPIVKTGATIVGELPVEGSADSPALLSQKASAYQRKLAAEGTTINIAAAVRAVQEGKTA